MARDIVFVDADGFGYCLAYGPAYSSRYGIRYRIGKCAERDMTGTTPGQDEGRQQANCKQTPGKRRSKSQANGASREKQEKSCLSLAEP
jgi:hypothetical protein